MKRVLATIISVMLLLQFTVPVFATTTVVSTSKTPDYDIWMADSLINGVDGAGSWYKTFRGLQEPVYRTLGAELLKDKPLVSMSTTWTVFFNGEYRNQFTNEQKYIYEIILMDYLKYGTSMDTSVKDLTGNEFKFAKKLYSTLANELSNNTLDYIDKNLSAEKAEKIWKNVKVADGINTAIKEIDDGKKSVKKLIEEISQYLVLKETKDNKIALLKASKAAAGSNKDYIKAVDDVMKALESTDLKYVQGRSLNYLWDQALNNAWGALTKANPVLSSIEFGISGLDVCFDSTKSASNNLKLVLLYTVDSYMSIGMSNATQTYLASKTSVNARNFRECFEAYAQFQMFGNKFASGWLGQYLNGGVLKDVFNQTFKKENIKTAQDLQNRCQTQINGRNKILKGINTYSDIYKGKYPISTNQATPAASIRLSSTSLTMARGTTATLKATVTGKSKTVTWSSSNKSVATIKSGKITAIKKGSTTITAKANGKTAKCKVTVKDPSIKLSKSSASIYVNASVTLKATVTGSSKKVTWSTSNKKVATVSSNGKVTGKKAGTVTITAKANGKTAKCKVTVKKKVVQISAAAKEYKSLLSGYRYTRTGKWGDKFLLVKVSGLNTPLLLVNVEENGKRIGLFRCYPQGYNYVVDYFSTEKCKGIVRNADKIYINPVKKVIIRQYSYSPEWGYYTVTDYDGNFVRDYSYHGIKAVVDAELSSYLKNAKMYTLKDIKYTNTAENRNKYLK